MASNALFEIDQTTIDSLAWYAVCNNNPEMMQSLIKVGPPSNLKECFDIANDNKSSGLIILLLKYAKLAPKDEPNVEQNDEPNDEPNVEQKVEPNDEPAEPIKPRALKIVLTSESQIRWGFNLGNKNSQFMLDVLFKPVLALKDLDSGLISKEELDYQNKTARPALSYLCTVSHIKDHVTLIEKMISLGADLNIVDNKGWTPLMCLMLNKYNSNYIEHILDLFLTNSTLKNNTTSLDENQDNTCSADKGQFTKVLYVAINSYDYLSVRIIEKIITFLSHQKDFIINYFDNKIINLSIDDLETISMRRRDEQMRLDIRTIRTLYRNLYSQNIHHF